MKPRAAFQHWHLAIAALSLLPLATNVEARDVTLSFAKDGHARIPFDLTRQHVWVRGRVNGSDSVWIVVDTGAAWGALDEGVARSLKMKLTGEHQARGSGGFQTSHTVENVTLEVPGLSIRNRRLDTIDLSAITGPSGRPMQYILGYELFRNCVVRFDYPAGMMDVWDQKHAPKNTQGTSVPMTLEDNHPYIEASVEMPGRAPMKGRFVIDTGSGAALIMAPDVVRRESLLTAFPRTLTAISRGVGGEVRSRVGRATSFSIGDLSFAGPTAVLPESTAGQLAAPGALGNIGGQILGRCAVSFDYAHQQVRFEKGADFARPFDTDMSGAALSRIPAGYEVRAVAPDSPAADAGLAVGDVVTTLDGEPAQRMDPFAVRALMQREGKVVTFGVTRGQESLSLKLTLRRII